MAMVIEAEDAQPCSLKYKGHNTSNDGTGGMCPYTNHGFKGPGLNNTRRGMEVPIP